MKGLLRALALLLTLVGLVAAAGVLDATSATATYSYDVQNGNAQGVADVSTRQQSRRGEPHGVQAIRATLNGAGVATEEGLTVAGEQATLHGAERLTQAGFDEATVAATKAGQVLQQADGATVYLNEVSPGRYDFIVEGENGVITAHQNWSEKAIERIARNYGWQGWP